MPFDWAVQQLRLSLFSSEPIVLTENDWKMLTGQNEAENRNAIGNGKQYSGKFAGGIFTMGYAATRADVALTYDDTAADFSQEPFLPVIGKWDGLSQLFSDIVCPFLADLSFPIMRIAFGAVILLPATSKEKSYEMLRELLKSVNVDSTHMRELNYRINWPQMSKAVPNLELNRITAWSSLKMSRAVMQITGTNMTFAAEEDGAHAVRLELDHNTSQYRKEPFEKDQKVSIFNELVSLAYENATMGERP